MASIVITANGDYVLPQSNGSEIRRTSASFVGIKSNTASAVTEFGYGGENTVFKAYTNGIISTEDIITHGEGAKLMVRVSGITSGEVTIDYYNVGE